jgi:Uma2 family endonuclease
MSPLTTKPAAPASHPSADVPAEPIYRLSVAQYHAMAELGILTEDDPVELLEGWLVQKMTNNPPHTVATQLMQEALRSLLPTGWFIAGQALVTTVDSEPEPDLALVRGQIRDYLDRHPGSRDVALVIEVADSSLAQDQGIKKRLYARSEFPVYWVVNLVDRRIEVYTEPTGPVETPDYRHRRDYGPEEIVLMVLEGVDVGQLAVRELLP